MPRHDYTAYCNSSLLGRFKKFKSRLEHFDAAPYLHFRKSRAKLIGWLILYGCLKPSEIGTVGFADVTGDYVRITFTRKNRYVTLDLDIAPVYTVVVNWIKPIYKPWRKPRYDIVKVSDRQVRNICKTIFNARCEDVRKACLAYYACNYSVEKAVEMYDSRRMAKQILTREDKELDKLLLEVLGGVPASHLYGRKRKTGNNT